MNRFRRVILQLGQTVPALELLGESICQTYQSLLDGLWELEMNLHQNVYEENRYLFPRAMRREAGLVAAGYGTGEE